MLVLGATWFRNRSSALTLIGLRSGYVLRAVESFPKQGAVAPWRMAQNYLTDMLNLRWRSVVHPNLSFSRAKDPS